MFLKNHTGVVCNYHLTHQVYNAPVWDYALDWKKKKKQNFMIWQISLEKKFFFDLIKMSVKFSLLFASL